MVSVFPGRQAHPANLLLAAVVAVAACGGAVRIPVDSPLDARKVAPAERTPTDHGGDAGPGATPPSTDATTLSADAAPQPRGPDAGPALTPTGPAGTVELRLVLPAGAGYCDQRSPCGADSHITIRDEAGLALTISLPYCPFTCNAICAPPPCVPVDCASTGSAYTGEQRIWDGQMYAMSSCGMNSACQQVRHAPPGRYVAVMCATPGRLTGGDGGPLSCQATGARTCIEVPFQFPSPAPVIGHLP